jgi:hypothetical protein
LSTTPTRMLPMGHFDTSDVTDTYGGPCVKGGVFGSVRHESRTRADLVGVHSLTDSSRHFNHLLGGRRRRTRVIGSAHSAQAVHSSRWRMPTLWLATRVGPQYNQGRYGICGRLQPTSAKVPTRRAKDPFAATICTNRFDFADGGHAPGVCRFFICVAKQ